MAAPERPAGGPVTEPAARAQLRGMTEVILETGAGNHAALALYTDCGYTLIEPYVAGRDPRINQALGKTLGDMSG